MCTYVTEKATVEGSGKGAQGWFELTNANVYFDHPFHAPFEHSLNIDFVNEGMDASARVAVELSAESARALAKAIVAALEAGQRELGMVPAGSVATSPVAGAVA